MLSMPLHYTTQLQRFFTDGVETASSVEDVPKLVYTRLEVEELIENLDHTLWDKIPRVLRRLTLMGDDIPTQDVEDLILDLHRNGLVSDTQLKSLGVEYV